MAHQHNKNIYCQTVEERLNVNVKQINTARQT